MTVEQSYWLEKKNGLDYPSHKDKDEKMNVWEFNVRSTKQSRLFCYTCLMKIMLVMFYRRL